MNQPILNLDINQEEHRGRTAVLTLLIPAILVLVLLFVLVGLRDGAEGALARLVDLLPVSYAFAAGMVASVTPCGVLMLPSYVIYQLGSAEDSRRHVVRRLLRAVRLALVVTAGFIAVFVLVRRCYRCRRTVAGDGISRCRIADWRGDGSAGGLAAHRTQNSGDRRCRPRAHQACPQPG